MKQSSIRLLILLVMVGFFAGCASNPEDRKEVAETEVARMPDSPVPFSNFSTFELKPLELSDAVKADEDKVEVARALEEKLQERLDPLLEEWNENAASEGPTLVIQPRLASLRVVSAGARFWAGAMMGDSFIDMDLVISEKESGEFIVQQRINKNANAIGGAWSIGATDKNLLDYIVDIAYQYFVENYEE